MLGRLIREDVTIALKLQPDLAPIQADRGQVEQLIMNLAVNARDAMPMGGRLTIETANVDLDAARAAAHLTVANATGPVVRLTVTDTGTGMTAALKAHLFEPFFTTKPPGKGTGLDLPTVRGIVTASGGSIIVSSEVGRGASFTIHWPQAEVSGTAADVAAITTPSCQGTETVLVVEDSEDLRTLVCRMLRRQGYTVLVAASGQEAIRLCDSDTPINVLLTDVVMPGTSGPELTRELIERRPGLKVIYMSGYTDDAIVHHGVLEPGLAFLHKPFSADALGRKLRDVLDR